MRTALALIVLAACGEDAGTLVSTVYGETFIEEGIPADAFADGWAVSFDRFLVSIGNVAGKAGEGGAEVGDPTFHIVDLAQATRRSPSVQLGVSPRASTALLAAAKAWAWLGGYPAITPDHVQTMLVPTWRHRIRLRPDAELEGVSVDAVLGSVVQQTRVPI